MRSRDRSGYRRRSWRSCRRCKSSTPRSWVCGTDSTDIDYDRLMSWNGRDNGAPQLPIDEEYAAGDGYIADPDSLAPGDDDMLSSANSPDFGESPRGTTRTYLGVPLDHHISLGPSAAFEQAAFPVRDNIRDASAGPPRVDGKRRRNAIDQGVKN